jgi:pyruvate-ferredoxin/flavodoxin oxidoreductase
MATDPNQYINTDGNTAVAHIAYGFSEVAAIYPITPSSDMGERADAWAAEGRQNIFGQPVDVVQMQSEGGAAGAIHGSLAAGAMATTFTASQGLMLMVPNMFKIAGELLPTVFHVSARSLACQSLSIFGDHSDVMATRGTGFAMLCSANVQEAQDMAAIAHLATLEAKIPFLHFFDGFRTSHSIQKIRPLAYADLRELLDMKYVEEFRNMALRPEAPVCKVGAQNPDVYFQGRETVNRFYDACPEVVKKYFGKLKEKTGRRYRLFEYTGAPDAESVLICMGSATETIDETIGYLNRHGRKVGALRVRLYRPFHLPDFLSELPASVKRIAVLDRTKEPGALGEPLYLDVVAALAAARPGIRIIGGRYGLSSKEFTPSMIKAVYDHLDADGWHGFTVGINDDVTKKSIPVREEIDTEQPGIVRCKFWGYGSDGTVSANKNAIKIIGDSTDLFVQGYFQYDSNKSGGWTISHLRFGRQPIRSEYLLNKVDFVALHRPQYIGLYDILEGITEGGTFLLNSSQKPENIFRLFTRDMQDTIRKKKVKVYAIDASKIAKSVGLGGRISSVMQTAFFKVSGVLPEAEAIALIKEHVREQFARKGQEIVEMNWKAIDASAEAVVEVPIPETAEKFAEVAQVVPPGSGVFAHTIMDPVLRLKGDTIPVSAMPVNGAIPTGTKRLEYKGVPGNPAIWIDKLPFVSEPYIAEPYIEYPPSCSGCGEVPYLHLVTQLYGDRMIIANATGCTSIFGGTFPLTPYTKDKNGMGPAWANSLFEDNAEYGLGMRLAVDANRRQLKTCAQQLAAGATGALSEALKKSLTLFDETTREAKDHAAEVKKLLAAAGGQVSAELAPVLSKVVELQDYFIDKSIWIIGGDGWAYDIGFGGVDHVMAGNRNVNLLVLDTEVYSNTGGQASKATPRAAVAKFASNGKKLSKKNLGVMMATYGNAYVASVNMGVDREKTALAFVEAERHKGPSIIIAYSPCIAHGYDMRLVKKQSEKATRSGYWPMYRFNPELRLQGQDPLLWDAPAVDTDFKTYIEEEVRYKMLNLAHPEEALRLQELAERDNEQRSKDVKHLSDI